jgi:heptose I phosphotransferase
LLTEELKDLTSLEDYCRDWQKNAPLFSHKKALIAELARVTRVMHQSGINHRDCYICHFLLDTQQATPKLFVIDLHRAQIRKQTPKRWLIKDLAGLYFSSLDIGLTQRDRLRFIKYYTQQPLRTVLQDLKQQKFWMKVKERGDQLYSKS